MVASVDDPLACHWTNRHGKPVLTVDKEQWHYVQGLLMTGERSKIAPLIAPDGVWALTHALDTINHKGRRFTTVHRLWKVRLTRDYLIASIGEPDEYAKDGKTINTGKGHDVRFQWFWLDVAQVYHQRPGSNERQLGSAEWVVKGYSRSRVWFRCKSGRIVIAKFESTPEME